MRGRRESVRPRPWSAVARGMDQYRGYSAGIEVNGAEAGVRERLVRDHQGTGASTRTSQSSASAPNRWRLKTPRVGSEGDGKRLLTASAFIRRSRGVSGSRG